MLSFFVVGAEILLKKYCMLILRPNCDAETKTAVAIRGVRACSMDYKGILLYIIIYCPRSRRAAIAKVLFKAVGAAPFPIDTM